MTDYPPAQPHGPVQRLSDDVFWVQGSIRMGPGMRINRNMVVLGHEGELTLLNPVRLDPDGEAALEKLGQIRQIVRLGTFHGMDDPYYVDRHGATLWCQPGSDHHPKPAPGVLIDDQTTLPVPDTRLFIFRETVHPECAVLVERGGGLLVTCDSVQHHTGSPGCSFLARLAMLAMGIKKPVNIGPPWRKAMTPKGGSLRGDFDRLLELEFDRLIGAHGVVCERGARAALRETVRRVYG